MLMKDEDEMSPMIKKMINEEVDKRMKAKATQELQQSLTKDCFMMK